MTMLATALTVIAIVTQDQAGLRGAPRETAAPHTVLWQGDSLEIRGTNGDYLQVYDHRRERAGYILATQVRPQSLKPESAPELLAVVRFLRDTPGAEALGISYAAAFLKAAPAEAIDGEVFDALGTFAERLARRATGRQAKGPDAAVGEHLEVAAAYGVNMVSFERDDKIQLCYEGDAFRRVLALPASDLQKALAALALTRHDCVSPKLTPVERFALDNWRAEVLERIDMSRLPEVLKNRLHLRKAGVWASLAWQRARRSELGAAATVEAANRALDELAVINKRELAETDAATYSDAAIRVGASRWAVEPGLPLTPIKAPIGLGIATTPGEPGETCVHLVDARHDVKNPLLTRCTYGIVWSASAVAHPQGVALTLAVQPLDTWREMWVFRQEPTGWIVDVVPPATDTPDLGYVEFAGWVPGHTKLLAAREAKVDGRYKIRFELLNLSSLEVERWADKPSSLSVFYRSQAPAWKARTVSMR
ncbi:MAG: hypothetical protein DVS81_19390 [Candidatus Accumulibacter meliphilus]|jgi:hypothetical protein|uniref:Uncharacterized protein n=1 Tax=Candidatus Accumulibacter meliphilus TaxID=2211374 RepID=A0A369XKH8_9PROT|nr:MAG: hypothetical protein DVS81_19390 [Candidatus Accumulibacter meliphilus]